MKKILKYPVLLLFALFIVAVSIADCLTPDKTDTEFESGLQQRPALTAQSLLNGKFATDYESYINDQFLFRNGWITVKSFTESLLGKTENNGVLYGKDGYMFEKLSSYDESRLAKNTEAVRIFCDDNYNLKITFALIPNSYAVLKDKVPSGAPLLDQESLISKAYEQAGISSTMDFFPVLEKHSDEYIYYRTDHHWTTQGAYCAYLEICDELNLTPVDLQDLESRTADGFYGTFFSKSKAYNAEADTITYYLTDASLDILQTDGNGGFSVKEHHDTLYDTEKLGTRDKYAMFLYSNHGISLLHGKETAEKESLLVFKDSYANSLLPFLTENYREILVVDLRYFQDVSLLVENQSYDDVLILYNLSTFLSDTDVVKLKYSQIFD